MHTELILFKHVHIIAKKCLIICIMSVQLHVSALLHLLDLHEMIYFNTSVRTGWENPNLIKIMHFTWRSKYVAWLLATLYCHKSALSNWNGVRLLVCPSVSMYQGGCYRTDVREIWYWGLHEIFREIPNFVKMRHFTCKPMYIALLPAIFKSP